MDTLEEVLEHYGIKGMKWGVRRSEKQLAKARKGRKPGGDTSKDADEALKTYVKAKTHGTQSLSNSELKALNERLNLERNFESLTTKEKGQGAKFAQQMVLEIGKQEAKNVYQNQVRKTITGR